MIEVRGFNEALAKAEEVEQIKKLARQHRQRKIKELVAQGIDRQMAATMYDTGLIH